MAGQKLIKMHDNTISEVQNEITNLESNALVLKKLYVILDVIHDMPIKEIIEKHEISQGTVYNWIKQWNANGIDGLKRKEGSKGTSKLTDIQFLILGKIILQMNLKTVKEVRYIIESVFGIKYSIRQVERIMKKLNYRYSKAYKIPKNIKNR